MVKFQNRGIGLAVNVQFFQTIKPGDSRRFQFQGLIEISATGELERDLQLASGGHFPDFVLRRFNRDRCGLGAADGEEQIPRESRAHRFIVVVGHRPGR